MSWLQRIVGRNICAVCNSMGDYSIQQSLKERVAAATCPSRVRKDCVLTASQSPRFACTHYPKCFICSFYASLTGSNFCHITLRSVASAGQNFFLHCKSVRSVKLLREQDELIRSGRPVMHSKTRHMSSFAWRYLLASSSHGAGSLVHL